MSRLTKWLLGATLLGGALSSCSGDKYTGTDTYDCPSQAVFTGIPEGGGTAVTAVSEFMARRCGTLDCHGNDARPMRLYGRFGLRDPDEANVAGGKPTTEAELLANYGAVCSVEPEGAAQAAADQGASAERLLVVRKARGIEGHKGGKVIRQGSPADFCLTGWLRGDDPAAVAEACSKAIEEL